GAAGQEGDRQPLLSQRAGDRRRPAQVADAQKMLDIEEDAAPAHGAAAPEARTHGAASARSAAATGRSSARTATAPPGSSWNRCSAGSRSRTGGLPTIGQPVASA